MADKRQPEDRVSDSSKRIRTEGLGAGAGAEVGRVFFNKPSVREFVGSTHVQEVTPHFIINAHGIVRPKDITVVPDGFVIYSLTNLKSSSQILQCASDYGENACGTNLHETPGINEYDAGKTIYNIQYSTEDDDTFRSGVFNCEEEDFIDEIDMNDNDLLSILQKLKEYTTERPIRVYNLTCNTSDKVSTRREKIVKVTSSNVGLIKTETNTYDYYKRVLSKGLHTDNLISLETLIVFFIEYYTKVIKDSRIFNLNYKETLKICMTINTWVRLKLAETKPDVEAIPVDEMTNNTKLVKAECMRTAGILLNATIGINNWSIPANPEIGKLYKIAQTLRDESDQVTIDLIRAKDTVSDIEKRVITNIQYYSSLIVNLDTYNDVRLTLISVEKDLLKIPKYKLDENKEEIRKLAYEHSQLTKWFKRFLVTSELVNISELSPTLTKLNELRESIKPYLPAPVGAARRTYRVSVKKRTKTIRAKDK